MKFRQRDFPHGMLSIEVDMAEREPPLHLMDAEVDKAEPPLHLVDSEVDMAEPPLHLMDLPEELLRCILTHCTGPCEKFVQPRRRRRFVPGTLLCASEVNRLLKSLSRWDHLWRRHLQSLWTSMGSGRVER